MKSKVPIEAKGLTKRIAKDAPTKVSGISKSVSKVLKRWLYEHIDNPYPSHVEKQKLSDKTGLATKQIQNWFINARKVRVVVLMVSASGNQLLTSKRQIRMEALS